MAYWSSQSENLQPPVNMYPDPATVRFTSSSTQSRSTPRNKFGKHYDLDETHAKRNWVIERVCDNSTHRYQGDSKSLAVERNSLIDQRHSIMYCRVQKIGSTFLTSLLHKLNMANKNEDGHTKLMPVNALKDIGFVNLHSSLLKSFKFMFTRDPYSRLLSGYVDKLFSVNTLYWKSIGMYIKNKLLNPEGQFSLCGNDVTFPQFIKYVIDVETTGKHGDVHFTPIYKHCRPCQIQYDFVGKMETFAKDTLVLVNTWNKRYGTNISYDDFEQETVLDRVNGHVGRLYGMRKQVMECTSFPSMMKRVWTDFQIRGFLSKYSSFPFTDEEADSLTKSQFISVLVNIITDKSTDRKAVKEQKMEALVQAYSLVPMEDLVKLREVVRPDCLLFGYNDSPAYIFNRTDDFQNSVQYRYFDIG
ncbi:carbohydrate sulfotransferase 12-like [Ylistrum balloti]|uniref:carbohydrate sulfotransferase 12-like n=1 Tax=Ylistrum balloti TaxID=509963 RepID=UPI002905CD65|nr:carbohydrate sulfotransferase 12-like [Ylistrum balloti]